MCFEILQQDLLSFRQTFAMLNAETARSAPSMARAKAGLLPSEKLEGKNGPKGRTQALAEKLRF